MATASLLWQKCLQFCGEKAFYNIKCICLCTILTALALILLYGGHCISVRLTSKVTHDFPHHVLINVPQHIMMFPDGIITTSWNLPVCCNRESTKWVLEFLVMVHTDNLQGDSTRKLSSLATFSWVFKQWQQISYKTFVTEPAKIGHVGS